MASSVVAAGAPLATEPVATGGGAQAVTGLSPREREVLRLIAAGHGTREIAVALSVSARTIERHVANLYTKIDAHNRADATAFAFRHGLV